MKEKLTKLCRDYLNELCIYIPERAVGTENNQRAVKYVANKMRGFGWDVTTPAFDVIKWQGNGSVVIAEGEEIKVKASPYSLGGNYEGELITVQSVGELETKKIRDKIVLLNDEIAKEQVMPKNFVFYNPAEHQKIVSLLEAGKPKALICATTFNPELAGGVYPFPMFEDGDFNIPSVYCDEKRGKQIDGFAGKSVQVKSSAKRLNSTASNVIAVKGKNPQKRIVITAHIDTKIGTPGAIDNATGVIVLLHLAELMKEYSGNITIELVAFNGEDYYSVPGQMNYIASNQNKFEEILLNINIDGLGYKDSKTAVSLFGLNEEIGSRVRNLLNLKNEFIEGAPWPQGDHTIFVHYGRPAIAVTSEWFIQNMSTQEITHTPKDNPSIVNCEQVAETSIFLREMIADL